MTTFTDLGKIRSEHMMLLLRFLKSIRHHPKSKEFAKNDAFKSFGIDDNSHKFGKPMDLNTVQQKLIAKKYARYRDFFSDIQLIWTNAKRYHKPESHIYKMAKAMEDASNPLINQCYKDLGISRGSDNGNQQISHVRNNKLETKLSCKDGETHADLHEDVYIIQDYSTWEIESESEVSLNDYTNVNEIPIDEKLSFREKVEDLNNIALSNFVKLVLVLCPSALADPDDDIFDIHVDQISLATFQKLDNWVDEQLAIHSETNESSMPEMKRKRLDK